MTNHPDTAPQGTRAELIAAGLNLFGRKGFAATSTRALAAAANTNVASIAYHFGSKDGLRRACGEEVARRVGGVLAQAGTDMPATPASAAMRIEQMLRRMVLFLAGSYDADDIVGFMLREIGEDGPVLDDVYSTMIEPMHRRFCALWAIATGREAESEATRLVVFSVIGQVLYFRIGRPIVERRLGWSALGPAEAARIGDLLAANLHAILDRERTQ
ncbi:CerR family C-terminal domain-containing protein [Albidovulum aquaemixtae]|nr:CerR family C-terminal domain-containing protein [Defluviimonas aquaemixtae]